MYVFIYLIYQLHIIIILHCVCIYFRYIKLTSPIINVVICIGAGVLYLEVIILGVPSEDFAVQSGLCNVR